MIVFLVGYMGAGKSTIGPLLADRLGLRFVDTDDIITARGSAVAEIFETRGEVAFRELEEEALRETCFEPDVVVGTGGGAIVREANRNAMRAAGTVLYLEASSEVLWARASGSGRPLAADRGAFDRLLAERAPLYAATANATIDASQPIEQVVDRAVEAVRV